MFFIVFVGDDKLVESSDEFWAQEVRNTIIIDQSYSKIMLPFTAIRIK